LLFLLSPPPKCRESLSAEFISRDHKYAFWLRVRNINHAQVPTRRSTPERNPGAFAAGPILTRSIQNLDDLVFAYLVIQYMRQSGGWIDIKSNLQASSTILTPNQLAQPPSVTIRASLLPPARQSLSANPPPRPPQSLLPSTRVPEHAIRLAFVGSFRQNSRNDHSRAQNYA
jgi:hypothetical protein